MSSVLATEKDNAFFISENFRELADSACAWTGGALECDDIKTNITALRDLLIKERQELIRQEIKIFSLV
jgi:hypothetical protein